MIAKSKQHIVIIEPSSSGLSLILAAQAIGIKTIVITRNTGDRMIPDFYLKQANLVIEAETHDEKLLRCIIKKQNKNRNIIGILPGFEYFVIIAARLSAYMNLPGLPSSTVECLCLKNKMRDQLKKAGIYIPRYVHINTSKDLPKISSLVEFPCVIKPINSSGSIHVSKVNTELELKNAYTELCEDKTVDLGRTLGNRAIVEEYIDGPEFSIEGYIENGIVYFVSITEKVLGPEPYFVELEHIVSPDMSSKIVKEIHLYVRSVIKALNVTIGPYHCELRLSKDGPVIMEIAARLAGDNICELIYNAYGINLAEIMIKNYIGNPVNYSGKRIRKYSAIQFYTLEKNNNMFNKIYGLEELKMEPGFQRFELLVKPGQHILSLNNSLGRVAKGIFIMNDYVSLKMTLEKARSLVRFSI